MKFVLLIFFLLWTGIHLSQAQNGNRYVWAPNGLNLRSGGAKSAPLLRKLPFGKAVTVLEELPGIDSVKETTGWYITGHWVKAAADKDTGYLFDGFLLPDRPVSFQPEKEYPKYNGGKIEKFLATHFASATGKKILKYYPPDYCGHPIPAQYPDECTQKYRIDFRGIVLTYEHVPEKNSGLELLIPRITLQQAYLWARYTVSEENSGQTVSYSKGRIRIASDGAGCSIELFADAEGRIGWSQHCGC